MPPATAASALRRSRDEADTTFAGDPARDRWRDAFRDVRRETERRAAPLSPEDQQVQSMPDASPTKWHRAHTTWFLEQFLLLPHLPGYQRVRRALRLSVQLVLRRRRPAPCAAAAAASITRPGLRAGRALSRAMSMRRSRA